MSLEKIFNFEKNLEESFYNYLTINGIPNVIDTRTTEELPASFVSAVVNMTGVDSEVYAKASSTGTGQNEYTRYTATITILVQTDRDADVNTGIDGFASSHDLIVATIRKLMLHGAINGTVSGVTALNSDYYELYRLIYSGEASDFDEDGTDQKFLEYSFSFLIKDWSL